MSTHASNSMATVAPDQSGAYAMAAFLATFPAGYEPKTDTRTPAGVAADKQAQQ